ncbi:MAG: acyltransferase [Pseudomonadota bacterium]
MSSERFVTLDALRGVFAVIVVLFHYALYFDSPLAHVVWLQSGYLMVDAFFVLSGFVMVHASAGRLQSARDAVAFMIRRFFRLWPLHALVLLGLIAQEMAKLYLQSEQGVMVAHPAFSDAFTLDKLVASVLLIHSLGLFEGQVWNVPSWSISTEFYAYLVFVLIACRASSARLVASSALLFLLAFYMLLQLPESTMDVTTQGGFSRCLCGFFAGVLAYHAYARLRQYPVFQAGLVWMQLPVVILMCIYLQRAGDGALGFWAPTVFFLLVIVFASDQGRIAGALQIAPFRFLGKISYSVYLLHYPLILLVSRVLELLQRRMDVGVTYDLVHGYPLMGFAVAWQMLAFMGALSALILATSYLSERFVERPFQKLGRRYASAFQP